MIRAVEPLRLLQHGTPRRLVHERGCLDLQFLASLAEAEGRQNTSCCPACPARETRGRRRLGASPELLDAHSLPIGTS